MRTFLLLGRPDCHLCEAFEEALQEYLRSQDLGARVDHACVDDRAEWRLRYGHRIPVLLDEAGELLVEGTFDPVALSDVATR